jgi:Protein of unknown function (DUF1566)
MNRWKQLRTGLLLATCLLISHAVAAGISLNQADSTDVNHKQGSYALGGKGPCEGKVFYVDTSGRHGLEAKTADEINPMIWGDAVVAAQAYGSGWRLPTSAELHLLYTHKKLIGGFDSDDYWSSTEQDVNSAWIQGFRTGDKDRYNKYSKLKVRAVRSF